MSCKNQPNRYQRRYKTDSNSIATDRKDDITGAPTGYRYQLQLPTGSKYYFTLENETQVDVEANGKKIENITTSQVGFIYQIVSDTANQYRIRITYDKFTIHINNNGEKKEISSEKADESMDAEDKLLAKIKGQSLYLTLDKQGKMLAIQGSKELADNIVSQVKLPSDLQKEAFEKQVSSLLGENFIQDNMAGGFSVFPDSAVYAGDSWTKKNTGNSQFNMSAISTFILDDIDDKEAAITISSKMSSAGTNTNLMGTNVTMNLSGKETGSCTLNTYTGMLMKQESKAKIDGTVQIIGQEVPIELTIKKDIDCKKL